MQKLWHFLISLLLLNIFTWNSEELITIKRGTHTSRGGNPSFFDTVMPLFRLRIFMQKLWHFLTSLLLLNIFTWNSEELFTIKRGTHTSRGGNPSFFDKVMPLFRLIIFMQKLWHFLISLLIPKIFTWNSEELITIKRGTHTSRGDNPPFFWQSYAPFLT